jgi:hypothetical protein
MVVFAAIQADRSIRVIQARLLQEANAIRVDRGVSASVRRGRVGGGKHVAVNFPLTLFTAEDGQLVVCLPRYLMSGEDFLLSGRSTTPVSQVAHLHDFVDRENDVHFDGLGTVLVPRLHRFAANEGFRILGNKDWITSIQRHYSKNQKLFSKISAQTVGHRKL